MKLRLFIAIAILLCVFSLGFAFQTPTESFVNPQGQPRIFFNYPIDAGTSGITTFANPTFGNGSAHIPFSVVSNGVNLLTEFQLTQGGLGVNFMTTNVAGGVIIPSNSAVWQANGEAAFVQQQSPTTNGVGVYGQCRVIGSSGNSGACLGMNSMVQMESSVTTLTKAIGSMELDFNNNSGFDVAANSAINADGADIASGGLKKPFRGLVVAATNSPSNAWRYAADLHHFTEYGLSISDFAGGGVNVGERIVGNASETQMLQVLTYNAANPAIRMTPATDSAGYAFQVTNAANNANRLLIDNLGGYITAGHIAQQVTGAFGGTCTMSAGTSCTVTLNNSYGTAGACVATVQSATVIAAGCTISGTTITITAASSNSSTWAAFTFGNPS